MAIRIFGRKKKEESLRNPGQQENEKQQIEIKKNTDEQDTHHSAQEIDNNSSKAIPQDATSRPLEKTELKKGGEEQNSLPFSSISTCKENAADESPAKKPSDDNYFEPAVYIAPPITYLYNPPPRAESNETDLLAANKLEACLRSHNIQVRVVHVSHGPDEIRYEMELAPGTRISSIEKLTREIAYSLSSPSVKLEAPIPGKSLIGISIPKEPETVYLREVLGSPAFENANSLLAIALGKDKIGTPVVCDLNKMPHLLIVGQTRSGKSTCISSIITSLIFNAGPEETRLIIMNANESEFNVFNGIPHLLLPVINSENHYTIALLYACKEAERRDSLFAKYQIRNIDEYNALMPVSNKPLPHIVIIIDGLERFESSSDPDHPTILQILMQRSHRCGIHLIVSTQNPSSDVLPTSLKMSFPSKIAFKTGTFHISQMILDQSGAEKLRGIGDMLYFSRGTLEPLWVQGCYISNQELMRITNAVKQANPSFYDPDVLDQIGKIASWNRPFSTHIEEIIKPEPEPHELLKKAVEIAITDGQISTSTLQRRLKIGYARAGRITDEMVKYGIISAKVGSKPQKCLVTRGEWERIKKEAGL